MKMETTESITSKADEIYMQKKKKKKHTFLGHRPKLLPKGLSTHQSWKPKVKIIKIQIKNLQTGSWNRERERETNTQP